MRSEVWESDFGCCEACFVDGGEVDADLAADLSAA